MSPARFVFIVAALFGVLFTSRAGEPVPAAFVPVLPKYELYSQGRDVYEQNCMICHGANGDGRGELALTLVPKPRPFASGVFKYRSTPAGTLPTDDDLKRTIRDGLAGTAMGMFTKLSDADLDAVIVYVKHFSRKWRKKENYAAPLEPPVLPAWFAKDEEVTKHAAKAAFTFTSICAACHGPNGDGKGAITPTLKDVWGEPDQPADLREAWLKRGTDLREVYLALLTGRDGTPMVSFAQTLSEEQRWDLVAFVETLRKKKLAEK